MGFLMVSTFMYDRKENDSFFIILSLLISHPIWDSFDSLYQPQGRLGSNLELGGYII